MNINEAMTRLNNGNLLEDISEAKKESVIIIIECSESAAKESLLPILDHMRFNGQIGHSYEIVADPDRTKDEGKQSFFFDGDGSDKIFSIKLNGEEWKKEK